jgi:metal-responsive CopG/Arc/MetJ family transcriptional regulator
MKGGARAGAGRKAGVKTERVTLSLPKTTVAALNAAGQRMKRSKFVNEAILTPLNKPQ